jgi:hypothetical protein
MFPDMTLCAYIDITVTYVMGTGNIFRATAIHRQLLSQNKCVRLPFTRLTSRESTTASLYIESKFIVLKAPYKTWEDDPGEEARRIWIWWSYIRDKFNAFSHALRLVALVQTSSASVERLFSVLKLIVESIGHSMLEETLETRLFVKYNMVRNNTYQSVLS